MIPIVTIYYPRAMVGNGGPTAATWMWARSLLDAGAKVQILYDSALEGEQPLHVSDVELVPIVHKGNGRWRRPDKLADVKIEKDSLVFLHSAFLAGNLCIARHARRQGAHTVFVPHGAYERAARRRSAILKRLWFLWEKRELAMALAIHAFVETEREPIGEVAGHTPVVVAPTPIALPTITWTGGGNYIAWFGRYDIEHKGLDLLIEAYAQVEIDRRIPLKLRGRDSTHGRQAVQDLVAQHGMEDWISVGPEINGDEKVEFLKNSEFFIMPSRWESFSIALIEVLALGVPSIVSDRMPIAAQLKNDRGAIVCSIEPSGLATAISAVLSDPVGAFSSINPRKYVENTLSSQVVGTNLLTQLNDLQTRNRTDAA